MMAVIFPILSYLPSLLCSCFLESPWTNIRPLLQLIDPCSRIDVCESACLGNNECAAYAFINAKCALLGTDSGKPQICVSPNPTCFIRTAACDETTSSTTSTSTTSSTTTTTTTTSPTTTTTREPSPCGEVDYEDPGNCPSRCSSPAFTPTNITCPTNTTMYSSGTTLATSALKCNGTHWTYCGTLLGCFVNIFNSPKVFAARGKVYCNKTG